MAKKLVEIGATELKKLRAKVEKEEARKKMKKDNRAFDGFGTFMKSKMQSAIRQCWRDSSTPRKLVLKRVALPNGFSKCEHPECKGKKHPKVFVDHIDPCGAVDSPGYLERTCVPSTQLQALCHEHHKQKTALDKKRAKLGHRPGVDFY